MIWRIRARSDFSRLAAEGQRVRAGVLWCTYLLDLPGSTPTVDSTRPYRPSPPRVAFALGRALGPAVVRNRVRRRLRALLRDASTVTASTVTASTADRPAPSSESLESLESAAIELRPGWYLFGAQPAAASRSFTELQFDLHQLLRRIHD